MNSKNIKRILLVEDEAFWASLLKLELERALPALELVHAENGEEAVQYVKESLALPAKEKKPMPYDAIITDIQMPIMDGCTAVKIIRGLLYTGPIIVWSAYRNSAEDLERILDIPVSGFCVKEGTISNLLMHLKNLKVIE